MLVPTTALLALLSLASTAISAPLRHTSHTPSPAASHSLPGLSSAQLLAQGVPADVLARLERRANRKKAMTTSTTTKVTGTKAKKPRKPTPKAGKKTAKKSKKVKAASRAYNKAVLALGRQQVEHATAQAIADRSLHAQGRRA